MVVVACAATRLRDPSWTTAEGGRRVEKNTFVSPDVRTSTTAMSTRSSSMRAAPATPTTSTAARSPRE
jgi:hypothetical protein